MGGQPLSRSPHEVLLVYFKRSKYIRFVIERDIYHLNRRLAYYFGRFYGMVQLTT